VISVALCFIYYFFPEVLLLEFFAAADCALAVNEPFTVEPPLDFAFAD
jgi:hypothetical protein